MSVATSEICYPWISRAQFELSKSASLTVIRSLIVAKTVIFCRFGRENENRIIRLKSHVGGNGTRLRAYAL